jgi:hypothetical protein
MPQVVACLRCRQQFMAEDRLAGTTVACPSCGVALAIPAALAPVVQAAAVPYPAAPVRRLNTPGSAAGSSIGPIIDSLAKYLPPEFRRRDRAIGLAAVVVAVALWLLLVLPSVPFLLTGMHLPWYGQVAGRIGGLSALFWIALFISCGGLFEWSFFMDSYKMQVTKEWFGEQGARWFLAGLGGIMVFAALFMLTVPHLMGLANRARFAAAGPLLPRVQAPPPPVPDRPAALAPLKKRDVRAPEAPAAPAADSSATAKTSAPAPVRPRDAALTAADEQNLPGTWRRLDGGFAIKFPAAATLLEDVRKRRDTIHEQYLLGRTKEGKDGVVFLVRVDRDERLNAEPGKQDANTLVVNDLPLVRSERSGDATEGYNAEFFVHRTLRHQYAAKGIRVSIDIRSRFEVDHPDVLALLPYVKTLQAVEPEKQVAQVDDGRWQGSWRFLPGELCALVPAALEMKEDTFKRSLGQWPQTEQIIEGTIGGERGVEYRLTVRHSSRIDMRNWAHEMQPHRDERHEIGAVSVNGLLCMRSAEVSPEGCQVDYTFQEGPHYLVLRIKSSGSAEDPIFRGLLAYAETIQRAPK